MKHYKFLKTIIDKFTAAIALLIFFPIMLGVAIAIYLDMGNPILFSQKRPGKDKRIFTLYKFRTMSNACDENGNLLPDEKRLTSLGKFLRKTSLDELPQLWNIAKGDMSFVGPRPLLIAYLDRYTPEQARRHEVMPGITGWAQVNGRNAIGWEERFRLDIWYVNNWNLWLDLEILLLTVWKVIKREGISQKGHATMEEFMGTDIQKSFISGKEVAPRSTNLDREVNPDTPYIRTEDLERLKACSREISEILHRSIPESTLINLEGGEKNLWDQILENSSPDVVFFLSQMGLAYLKQNENIQKSGRFIADS